MGKVMRKNVEIAAKVLRKNVDIFGGIGVYLK